MAPWRSMAGFFQSLWRDRNRVAAALACALVLWYLIGQRVEADLEFTCEVRVVSGSEADPNGNFLVVRVPDHLVFLRAEPPEVELVVTGNREQLAALNKVLRGFYNVPADFCGDQEVRTREILVTESFTFSRMEAQPSLRFKEPVHLSLTVARRITTTLALDRNNLMCDPGGGPRPLPPDVKVELRPTFIDVLGPPQEIERIRTQPELLKMAVLRQSTLDSMLLGPRSVTPRPRLFVDGQLQPEGLFTTREKVLEITLRRELPKRPVRLTNLDIVPIIRERARRENVNWERPLKITPPALDAVLEVPEEYFAAGHQESDLRLDLQLLVDTGQMNFASGKLPVIPWALPPGATIQLFHNGVPVTEVDVEWNIVESE